MATAVPEVLATRADIAESVAEHFQKIKGLVAEAGLSGDALVVISDGQAVDVLEWARLVTKMALEETPK